MTNTSPQHFDASTNIGTIFAQLNEQNVEEFYTGYQYWNLHHQIEVLQICLNDVRKQIIENTEHIQQVQPTAIELATLVRLQSNGVSDVDLLDRMLERGESWLDRTMQRLDYLEKLDDFISDDYTQWCQHALEGAYDWIDSVLDGNTISQPSTATALTTTEDVKEEELIEATEELFLQKISIDEDEAFTQEITSKRPSITTVDLEEAVASSENTDAGVGVAASSENTAPGIEEVNPLDIAEVTKTTTNGEDAHTEYATSEESSSTSNNEQLTIGEPVDISPAAHKFSSSQTDAIYEPVPSKRPSFIKLFFGKIWGS